MICNRQFDGTDSRAKPDCPECGHHALQHVRNKEVSPGFGYCIMCAMIQLFEEQLNA